MEDENKYEFPDFSPDDDTEEMVGVPIYKPLPRETENFPDWDSLPPPLPELEWRDSQSRPIDQSERSIRVFARDGSCICPHKGTI